MCEINKVSRKIEVKLNENNFMTSFTMLYHFKSNILEHIW